MTETLNFELQIQTKKCYNLKCHRKKKNINSMMLPPRQSFSDDHGGIPPLLDRDQGHQHKVMFVFSLHWLITMWQYPHEVTTISWASWQPHKYGPIDFSVFIFTRTTFYIDKPRCTLLHFGVLLSLWKAHITIQFKI